MLGVRDGLRGVREGDGIDVVRRYRATPRVRNGLHALLTRTGQRLRQLLRRGGRELSSGSP